MLLGSSRILPCPESAPVQVHPRIQSLCSRWKPSSPGIPLAAILSSLTLACRPTILGITIVLSLVNTAVSLSSHAQMTVW
jgi:hypothetical protein